MNQIKDFIQEKVGDFLIKTQSKDGCPLIICGYCVTGTEEEVVQSLQKINHYTLGSKKDVYGIDYILASSIQEIVNKNVYAIGATVQVDGVLEVTGGVIGNPKNDPESAEEEIEEIHKNMFVISFPGGPGVVLIGIKEQALYIREKIIEAELKIEKVLPMLEAYLDRFFCITDGTGEKAIGSAYIKNYNRKSYETFKS